MQFTAECWVKTYRLESDWLGAFGWEVRAVFSALAVKFDAAGDIPVGSKDNGNPMRVLTGLTGIPEAVLKPAIDTLIQANVLCFRDTEQGHVLHDPRFLERHASGDRKGRKSTSTDDVSRSDRGAMTAAERMRAYRSRKREARSGSVTENVTNVTKSVTNRYVTRDGECYGENVTVTETEPLFLPDDGIESDDRYGQKERKKERKKIPPSPPGGRNGDESKLDESNPYSSQPTTPVTATESGTFPVGQNRHDTGLEGNDGGIATVEYLPPLPAPLEAQQSTSVTTKFRDLGIRRFEATNIASAYASGIVEGRKQAGEAEPKYGVSAKHQRALDDAVDTHAPSQATKFAWLREAAFLFARYGFDGPSKILSYEPTAFAAWLNSGHYAKAKAKDAAEKSRQETTKLYLYTSRPKPPKTERLRTKIDQLRDHAKYCEEHNFVLTPDTSPENLRARANELEAELEELLQSEASEANHGT